MVLAAATTPRRDHRRPAGQRPGAVHGILYLELHGRQDGRTRSIVFVQMGILVLLAVFTADAADGSGRGFAVVYGVYQVLQTGLWYTVWRQDRRDHPEYQAATGGYVVGMGMSVAVILASALLPAAPRLLVWGDHRDRRRDGQPHRPRP